MQPARQLWQAVEPVHAVVYFSPGPADAARELGLKGFWMGYFAGRAAPLGPVGPEPVEAMFFGFAPARVRRALPDAWSFASPADVLRTRLEATAATLCAAASAADFAELAALLAVAVRGCDFGGRPLAAAWSAVEAPDEPVAAAWLHATVLREHRGDGHIAAAVASGLNGLETSITHVASGPVTREVWQRTRAWTDEEWDAAAARLEGRGIIDRDGALTGEGRALRKAVEDATDRLAEGPVDALGPDRLARLVALARPIGLALADAGRLPDPNPIGVPRP